MRDDWLAADETEKIYKLHYRKVTLLRAFTCFYDNLHSLLNITWCSLLLATD